MSGVGMIPGLQNGNPVVFMDVTIGGHNAGRIKMEARPRQRPGDRAGDMERTAPLTEPDRAAAAACP